MSEDFYESNHTESPVIASLNTELAAERAKVKELEEENQALKLHAAKPFYIMQEDGKVVCGSVAMHAMKTEINELKAREAVMRTYSHETVKGLVDHREARIKELEAERLEQSEKLRHINRAYDELIAQNAVMRDFLERLQASGLLHGSTVLHDKLLDDLENVLSLTPSDAAEMSRKKDEALFRCVEALSQLVEIDRRDNLTAPDMAATDACRGRAWENATHAIEAARAAGVEGV